MNIKNFSIQWKQMSSAALILASVSLLSACSTRNDIVPFTPMVIDDTHAAIYVYRPKAMANAMYSPDLYIDDELKFPVKNGRLSRLKLPAGDYLLKLDAGDNSGQQTKMSLQTDTTYYIRVTTSLKINNSVNYQPYQRSFIMEKVQEDKALVEIAKCCAKAMEDPAAEIPDTPAPDNSDGGFSVDKTQNPFSH
jgi:hypothetical protein